MLNSPAFLGLILVSFFANPVCPPSPGVGDDATDRARFEVLKDISYLDSSRQEKADLYLPVGRGP